MSGANGVHGFDHWVEEFDLTTRLLGRSNVGDYFGIRQRVPLLVGIYRLVDDGNSYQTIMRTANNGG